MSEKLENPGWAVTFPWPQPAPFGVYPQFITYKFTVLDYWYQPLLESNWRAPNTVAFVLRDWMKIPEDDPWYQANPLDICPPSLRKYFTAAEWKSLRDEQEAEAAETDRLVLEGELVFDDEIVFEDEED